ncbi:MAG TPA: tetratricopeptide repeat protein [Polyangiaceae bacterium]|nr:tetratricopeptide repeat protein [Polyangiaceae bacterium]
MRFGVFPAALVVFATVHASAQSAAATPASGPSGDRVLTDGSRAPGEAAAHEHFERALVWYRAGKYQLAVEELDAALDRDPGGKDLVFNLALVQEKLGDLDGAIRSLQRFQTMEKDAAEIERAAQTIQRLEGARAELIAPERSVPAAPAARTFVRSRGKFDVWVAGTGGLSAASLLVGAVFAVRTLALAPNATSFDASRARRAHASAVISDVALSTSLLLGAGAAVLYFGRYSDVASERCALPLRLPRVSAAWLELRY